MWTETTVGIAWKTFEEEMDKDILGKMYWKQTDK